MRLNLESPGKWGLIRVMNRDGTVNRDIRITTEQLTDLQRNYTWRAWGVTDEEIPRSCAYGMGFEVGDVQALDDGGLLLKDDERIEGGVIVQRFIRFKRNEWRGTPPNITVDESVLSATDWNVKNLATGALVEPRSRPIESIQAGEMVKRVTP